MNAGVAFSRRKTAPTLFDRFKSSLVSLLEALTKHPFRIPRSAAALEDPGGLGWKSEMDLSNSNIKDK
jgi:hypothetical protein